MRFWQTIKQAPWPLRIIYFVLAVYLVVGLIAAVAWIEFGRDAEDRVVALAGDVSTIVGIVLVPLLLIGLILFLFIGGLHVNCLASSTVSLFGPATNPRFPRHRQEPSQAS